MPTPIVRASCTGLYFAALTWAYLRTLPLEGAHLPEIPEVGKVYALQVRDGELSWEHGPAGGSG